MSFEVRTRGGRGAALRTLEDGNRCAVSPRPPPFPKGCAGQHPGHPSVPPNASKEGGDADSLIPKW